MKTTTNTAAAFEDVREYTATALRGALIGEAVSATEAAQRVANTLTVRFTKPMHVVAAALAEVEANPDAVYEMSWFMSGRYNNAKEFLALVLAEAWNIEHAEEVADENAAYDNAEESGDFTKWAKASLMLDARRDRDVRVAAIAARFMRSGYDDEAATAAAYLSL